MNLTLQFKKTIAISIIYALLLSSCAAGANMGSSSVSVGPAMSSSLAKAPAKEKPHTQKTRLDIIVPVFDPGIPKDPANYEKEGVWPELRRAEASRFAYQMKTALEKTGAFGAVRVMPDATATGDLYIMGSIEQSDGEAVKINIKANDISGKSWLNKSFKHEVKKEFYRDIRNQGKDAYAPVFTQAAERLVKELNKHDNDALAKLQKLTTLRFAANFSDQTFAQHIQIKHGIATLLSYPSDDDPMLKRILAVRIKDQLFIDNMQSHYEQFNQQMDASYTVWQKQSFEETVAKHKANSDMVKSAFAGVALIGLSVLSAIAGGQSNSSGGYALGSTGAFVGGMAGMKLLEKSFQTNEEVKFHRQALAELGQSIDSEMAPQVVEFEKSTKKLTGNAKQQFSQWRSFLKKMYMQEATPDVQL